MINFNFTLDDIDASNFADILNKNIAEMKTRICFYQAGVSDDHSYITNDDELKWYESHVKYLEDMYATIMKGQTRLT